MCAVPHGDRKYLRVIFGVLTPTIVKSPNVNFSYLSYIIDLDYSACLSYIAYRFHVRSTQFLIESDWDFLTQSFLQELTVVLLGSVAK